MGSDEAQADETARERPATAALAASHIGPIGIDRSEVDIWGTRRRKPQLIVSAFNGDMGPSSEQPDFASLRRAIGETDTNEIYLRWPRQCEAELKPVLLALEDAGFQRENTWPVLPHPSAKDDGLLLRVARPQPVQTSRLTPPYFTGGAECTVSDDHQRLIAALQAEIENSANHAILNATFDAQYGVRHTMTVGSTSRQTYAAFPVDFDLVVHTECERTTIELADAKLAGEKLVESLARSKAFESYCRAIGLSAGKPSVCRPQIALQFLGARGPQSLVARYDLVWRYEGREDRVAFLDITFGKLPQLIGYEIWFQRFLKHLGPLWAERARSEIRAAKTILKEIGEVYGSANHGLRAHAVEQWIIQSLNYRASGIPVGTLDNALRLIFEEGATDGSGAAVAPLPFEEFKARLPLWHPGWWEGELGHGDDRRNVNLWDLLGDSDAAAAEHKWQKLIALSLVYVREATHADVWKLDDLARSAEAMLRLLKNDRNSRRKSVVDD